MMAQAFTGGVKMGGLTNRTEIRILLCYLIKTTGPLTREAMEAALLQEELVNYFEFAGALGDLCAQGLAVEGEHGYTITPKGATVAQALADDLPRSVRESAVLAVIRVQSWVHKAAQNRAVVEQAGGRWRVSCAIRDEGSDDDALTLQLTMPDRLTAEQVKNLFIACGSEIYAKLLSVLSQTPTDDQRPPEGMV